MPPGWTELAAVKDAFRRTVVKLRLPSLLLRSSNATSEGELTRVGTCEVLKLGGPDVRPTSESFGKTRYISTRTFAISEVAEPLGSSPVKVAAVTCAPVGNKKSSALSISILPVLSGCVADAISLVGKSLL